jgi:hypothetical protein
LLIKPSFLSYHPSLSSSLEPGYGKQPSANMALSNASSAGTADWLSDTGANQHVTPDLANLTSSNYISIMIIYMSVMVRDFPYLISGILKYRHHIVLSLCLTFFMSYILRNLCFLFRNFILITMFILNFTHFFYVKDLYALTRSSVMSVPQAYWSPYIYASADQWHR